ncbi:MAG TPA: glycosyltransferase family 4 protein [Longimicrobiales bacterium]|nr:glycosyltransferase family 4 protein [Longimicrobiales bacterium]
MHIRFFSAVEPPFAYYRVLLPHLVRQGHTVEIVITDSEYRDQAGGAFPAFMERHGVRVNLVRVGAGKAGRGWRRVALYGRYVLSAVRRSLFGHAVDMNVFLTQPPLFFLWGMALKALRRQRYGVVLMDLYPDVLVESGLARRSAPHIRLAAWATRLGHRSADALFAIGRCTREYMIRAGVRPERVHLTPNWSNDAVRPIARLQNPLRDELGLGDRFVVMYSGNIGVSHDFDDIIEVARRMKNEDGIRFVFAGDGSRRRELERARDTEGLDNIVLLPFQPVENLARSLALGDMHFVSLRERFEAVVVPSKTYSVLNAGRAILYQGHTGGEIARMVEEEDIGLVVAPGDADALEAAVRRAMADPQQVAAWGERAHRLSQARYSQESAIQRYADVFAKLHAGEAPARRQGSVVAAS